MNRSHVSLLPLSVLAVVVAAAACSKARTEETTHFIPPAATLLAPPAEAKTPGPQLAAARAEDEKPTAEDVKEFERRVSK
ncbi:MAG TPA: hypothetical protein VIW03_09345 [Anaeromyxobacter sp.]